ncbi:restriction endonuclease subunit S [Enterococcus faecalis]|uniref:restriction endonuclease subunit S n=1 Tax=Enterococcus faecalis TaxID=1351 RepID=UPI001A0315CF|nr:restriction endonuclease subunit S [Enterococcus faecalis]
MCKLGDLANIVGGGTPNTNNPKCWDGNIDWYAPAEIKEKIYVTGSKKRITELGLQKSSAKVLPIGTVLFTSRAGIGNTAILAKKGTTNQGFQSIIPNKNKLDTYFIFSRTHELKKYGEAVGAGSTFVEVSGKQMAKMPMLTPRFNEQQAIGMFFKKIDDIITLHQRKLDQLKELKKVYLQAMFVSMKTKNNKVPKLRFADFKGEWDQRKSKELFIPKSEKNQPTLPVLSVTQDSGVVYRDQVGIDIKYDSTTLKNYKVVNKDDFVISLRSFQGGFELSDKKGITSPAYTIFVPKDIKLHDNLFWKTQFKTFQFIEALKTVTFGIRDGKSISFTEFGDLKLCFPKNKKEQQKIGKFFEELDHAISIHQNKLTQLNSLKKSYLQNMFI